MQKFDMVKAYNLMDWGFIHAILEAFRFDQLWIDRIKQCISECQFLVLLNGLPCSSHPHAVSKGWPHFKFLVHYRQKLFLTCAHLEVPSLSQYSLSTKRWYSYLTRFIYSRRDHINQWRETSIRRLLNCRSMKKGLGNW